MVPTTKPHSSIPPAGCHFRVRGWLCVTLTGDLFREALADFHPNLRYEKATSVGLEWYGSGVRFRKARRTDRHTGVPCALLLLE